MAEIQSSTKPFIAITHSGHWVNPYDYDEEWGGMPLYFELNHPAETAFAIMIKVLQQFDCVFTPYNSFANIMVYEEGATILFSIDVFHIQDGSRSLVKLQLLRNHPHKIIVANEYFVEWFKTLKKNSEWVYDHLGKTDFTNWGLTPINDKPSTKPNCEWVDYYEEEEEEEEEVDDTLLDEEDEDDKPLDDDQVAVVIL
jgi:hypothetical protein